MDELITAAEAARACGFSRQRWYQLDRRGKLPPHAQVIRRGMGAAKLWARSEVEAFKVSRNATLVSKNATPC